MGNCQNTLCDTNNSCSGIYNPNSYIIADLMLFSDSSDLQFLTYDQASSKIQKGELILPAKSQLVQSIEDKFNINSRETFTKLKKFNFRRESNFNESVPFVGPIRHLDGSMYIGQVINGKKNGWGKILWADGAFYEGDWKDDSNEGYGRMIHATGDYYEGEWVASTVSGQGQYVQVNGASYQGEWKDDKQDGEGVEEWEDGSSYKGSYKEGSKHGYGFFFWGDGTTYRGNFVNNALEGKGQYLWPDGRLYKGDWLNNMMDGSGSFVWPDKKKYVGKFKNDMKDGYGKLYYPDGSTYDGFWKHDLEEGQGKYTDVNGKEQKGVWKAGDFLGQQYLTLLLLIRLLIKTTYLRICSLLGRMKAKFEIFQLIKQNTSLYYYFQFVILSKNQNLNFKVLIWVLPPNQLSAGFYP